jgi:hypothetical protein
MIHMRKNPSLRKKIVSHSPPSDSLISAHWTIDCQPPYSGAPSASITQCLCLIAKPSTPITRRLHPDSLSRHSRLRLFLLPASREWLRRSMKSLQQIECDRLTITPDHSGALTSDFAEKSIPCSFRWEQGTSRGIQKFPRLLPGSS